MYKYCLSFFFLSYAVLCIFFTQISLASEKFRTVGIYPAENGAFISVASGRISTAFEAERAKRLAREQALRKARYQLAKHIYKDKISGPGKYSVQIQGSHVVHEEIYNNHVFVAVQAHPKQVQFVLIPRSPLENFTKVNVAPLVNTLLTKAPLLVDGGASIFDVESGWVALGIGYTILPDSAQENDLNKAKIVAKAAATEALTSFIYGMKVSTNVEEKEFYAQGVGAEVFKQWIKSTSREEVAGIIKNAQWAGQWQTEDNYLGVALVVARPVLDLGFAQEEDSTVKEKLYKSDIALPWQKQILSRPWIKTGGVSLCVHEDKLYVIVIESGALQNNNTAYNRTQLPTLIDVKARRQITQFLLGVTSNTLTLSEEVQRIEQNSAKISEHLHKVTKENVLGAVANIQRLGSWFSKDEKTLFQAFIVPFR